MRGHRGDIFVLQAGLLQAADVGTLLRQQLAQRRGGTAQQAAQVGGDWYDAFVTASGSTMLVVGDVSGHDQIAAATMGQVRNVLRGLAFDSEDGPADLLRRLDKALNGLELDTLATAVLARVEQPEDYRADGRRRLRWTNAGHLPPLLREPDGTVHRLERGPDLLLGLIRGAERSEHTVDLVPAGWFAR